MFLDITQMQLGKVRFQETFPAGAIEFLDQQLRQAAPIEASGTAELAQALREIRVTGHVKTAMECVCDRCLETIRFPIDADFSLLYRPAEYMPQQEEIVVNPAEVDLGFYEGQGLELTDVIREQVLLSIPMQRVCREDCQGICPVCGRNRNLDPCDCHVKPADDRWAGLKNL